LTDNLRGDSLCHSCPPYTHHLPNALFFNFRLPAKAVARSLPVSWLAPQEVRGYGVASFCILDLRGITVAPLTTQIGLTSRVRIGTQLIFEQGGSTIASSRRHRCRSFPAGDLFLLSPVGFNSIARVAGFLFRLSGLVSPLLFARGESTEVRSSLHL
jgi:hypothetical protein